MKSNTSIPNALPTIEGALKLFEIMMKTEFNQLSTMLGSNITKIQENVIKHLQDHKEHIVLLIDKNLGPCVMNMDECMRKCASQNLYNSENYERSTKEVAKKCNNTSIK